MKPLPALYSLVSGAVCRIKRGLYRRGVLRAKRVSIPVISVGNITLGGSEKTPLTMELLAFFQRLGRRPALITRGYKGTWEKKGGMLSDGRAIYGSWREAGDEPFMAALNHPGIGIFVGRDRFSSCLKAAAAGFDVVVLDDGFQHLRLHRDLDIVLHGDSRGRARREGVSAFEHAGLLLLKKNSPSVSGPFRRPRSGFSAVFEYDVGVQGVLPLEGGPGHPPGHLKGHRLLAFCGIAGPERFFALLRANGLDPTARLAFPDHFEYPETALDRIAKAARKAGCGAFITTEKDAVKLRGGPAERIGGPIFVLKIRLGLPEEFFAAVRQTVDAATPERP
jgi:tetraacyldisaccharide 4'-kinase